MQKVIFLRGLPGSGKSTWAKEFISKNPNWVRTNKDEIRLQLGITNWSKEQERIVEETEYMAVEFALRGDSSVIIDNTHFNPKFEMRYRELADRYKAEFEIKFFDTPLHTCLERNRNRENPVPEKVIMNMWRKHIQPDSNYWDNPDELPECVIVDLDGTLCLFDKENPYDRDFSKDKLNEAIRDILWGLKMAWTGSANKHIIIFSGRDGKFQEITQNWLFKNDVPYNQMYMRSPGDTRSDVVVKEEFYNWHIKDKYKVRFVIDDRKQVKRLWNKLGLFVFDVNQFDIEF